MSSKHLCASIAGIIGVLLLMLSRSVPALASTQIDLYDAANLAASPLQAQPRDPRRDARQPVTSREQELVAATVASPTNVANWLELAKLQEARGATAEAERTFEAALSATGGAREVLMSMAGLFNRLGQFDRTMTALQQAAAANPTDPAGHHLVAVYYWDKAHKDLALTPADKLMYIDAGLDATDRALALKPDFVDSLTYKNLLLRLKSNLETDPVRRKELITEADKLRNRALELSKARADAVGTSPTSGPPPPAPPPPPGTDPVDGLQPVRVGGNVKAPAKIHDVAPVYPQEALDARASGLVILEALIDTQGNVSSARVLRSIPTFDQAAIDAVKQWRFTPTLLNGVPVPVIMTVTVNFTVK